MSAAGPSRRKSMSGVMSEVGGKAEVFVTFRNDVNDPFRTCGAWNQIQTGRAASIKERSALRCHFLLSSNLQFG